MKTTAQVLDELLERVTRYDASIQGGCECCGSWIEYDQYDRGDLVKYDHLEDLVNMLKAELAEKC